MGAQGELCVSVVCVLYRVYTLKNSDGFESQR